MASGADGPRNGSAVAASWPVLQPQQLLACLAQAMCPTVPAHALPAPMPPVATAPVKQNATRPAAAKRPEVVCPICQVTNWTSRAHCRKCKAELNQEQRKKPAPQRKQRQADKSCSPSPRAVERTAMEVEGDAGELIAASADPTWPEQDLSALRQESRRLEGLQKQLKLAHCEDAAQQVQHRLTSLRTHIQQRVPEGDRLSSLLAQARKTAAAKDKADAQVAECQKKLEESQEKQRAAALEEESARLSLEAFKHEMGGISDEDTQSQTDASVQQVLGQLKGLLPGELYGRTSNFDSAFAQSQSQGRPQGQGGRLGHVWATGGTASLSTDHPRYTAWIASRRKRRWGSASGTAFTRAHGAAARLWCSQENSSSPRSSIRRRCPRRPDGWAPIGLSHQQLLSCTSIGMLMRCRRVVQWTTTVLVIQDRYHARHVVCTTWLCYLNSAMSHYMRDDPTCSRDHAVRGCNSRLWSCWRQEVVSRTQSVCSPGQRTLSLRMDAQMLVFLPSEPFAMMHAYWVALGGSSPPTEQRDLEIEYSAVRSLEQPRFGGNAHAYMLMGRTSFNPCSLGGGSPPTENPGTMRCIDILTALRGISPLQESHFLGSFFPSPQHECICVGDGGSAAALGGSSPLKELAFALDHQAYTDTRPVSLGGGSPLTEYTGMATCVLLLLIGDALGDNSLCLQRHYCELVTATIAPGHAL